MKELCVRFRQTAASAAVRVSILDSKYSDHSLSSSAQSRTSSNPTTPIKMHTQSLATRATISKRLPEFQSILTVIDERKLILFGLLHGLIRRIEKFPVFLKKEDTASSQNGFTFYPHLQMQIPMQIHHGNGNTDESSNNVWDKYRKKMPILYSLFDGSHSFDKICLAHGLSQTELDDIIDRDPDVYTIWK